MKREIIEGLFTPVVYALGAWYRWSINQWHRVEKT